MQHFFYASLSICTIITTVFFCALILHKIIPRRLFRRRKLSNYLTGDIEAFREYVINKFSENEEDRGIIIADIEKLKRKIDHLLEPGYIPKEKRISAMVQIHAASAIEISNMGDEDFAIEIVPDQRIICVRPGERQYFGTNNLNEKINLSYVLRNTIAKDSTVVE